MGSVISSELCSRVVKNIFPDSSGCFGIHIFVQADPQTAPLEIAKTLKSISAVHLFNRFPKLKSRKFWGSGLWSRGTYYATVGHLNEETVRKYIATQKTRG